MLFFIVFTFARSKNVFIVQMGLFSMLTVYQHFITTWQPNVKYFCNSSQYSTWSFSPHGSTCSSRRRTTFFAHQKLFWCINTTHQCSYTHPIFATAWVLSFPEKILLREVDLIIKVGRKNKESWLLVRHRTHGFTYKWCYLIFYMYNFFGFVILNSCVDDFLFVSAKGYYRPNQWDWRKNIFYFVSLAIHTISFYERTRFNFLFCLLHFRCLKQGSF